MSHDRSVTLLNREAGIALTEHPQKKSRAVGKSILTNYFHKHIKRELDSMHDTPIGTPKKVLPLNSLELPLALSKEKT